MKKIFFCVFIVTIVGISCQPDDPPTPPTVAVKYMSSTSGSTWNYELVNNLVVSTTPFTLTSTSRDSTINGKSYHVFTNSSGSANEYYNITGNDYYNFRSLPSAFGGTSVENIYLKDNAAVGASWSQAYPVTISGFALNVTVTSTISEKGITKTVTGITYNDVIKVTTTIAVTVSGIPLPAGAITTDIYAYYAPKFGMIQSKNKIDINFSGIVDHVDQLTNLKTADIK